MIAPLAGACATPALSGLVSRSAGKTVLLMSGTSKVKNENPDDFATYLAKRQAAAEGREWTPAAAPAPSYSAPAPAGGDVDDVMARVNAMMRGETPPAPAPAAAAPAAAPSYAAPAAGREDAAAIMARVN